MTASELEQAWAARTDAVRVFRERAVRAVEALRKEDAAELADQVESGIDDLATQTVHELWRAMAWLGIDQKMRADVTTSELMARWPWTVRGAAGGALFKRHGGPSPRVNWPGDAAPADVARWMWLALKEHDHPLADDDGTPTDDPDASDLVRLARDGTLPTLARKMAELRAAGISEAPPDNPWWWWPPPPSGAGTMLPAVRLEHPDGGDWWWWPTAVADLFLSMVRAEATHARATKNPAVLVRVVHTRIVDLMRPDHRATDRHLLDSDGNQLLLLERMSALDVPAVEMAAIPKLLKRGVDLLGSIHAHKTVLHFVTAGHKRVAANEADARTLSYPGGWGALAEAAHVTEAEDARAIVVALAHVPYQGPASEVGNLLAYSWRPHAPGRSALVRVVLGDMLLPHFVHAFPKGTRARSEARQLVPVIDIPPLVGRKNEHGAQVTLQWLLMAELRTHARELAEQGSVYISPKRWDELATLAGVPPTTLARVKDRWLHDGSDAPAFLERCDEDRFTLADTHRAAREFLRQAGLGSATNARRAAAVQQKRLRGRRKTK